MARRAKIVFACILLQAAVVADPLEQGFVCEIDTLREEFGTVTLELIEHHRPCCGALRRFLKVAQSGSQPWKLEVDTNGFARSLRT
jgi:hypothetical protein